MAVEQYLANIANLIKSGYRSNAFAPYVWYSAVISSVQLIVMLIIDDILIRRIFACTLVTTVLFGMYMYYKLFKADPRLLQSESFRLEDKKLDLIAQKGSDIAIMPVNLSTPVQEIEERGSND